MDKENKCVGARSTRKRKKKNKEEEEGRRRWNAVALILLEHLERFLLESVAMGCLCLCRQVGYHIPR